MRDYVFNTIEHMSVLIGIDIIQLLLIITMVIVFIVIIIAAAMELDIGTLINSSFNITKFEHHRLKEDPWYRKLYFSLITTTTTDNSIYPIGMLFEDPDSIQAAYHLRFDNKGLPIQLKFETENPNIKFEIMNLVLGRVDIRLKAVRNAALNLNTNTYTRTYVEILIDEVLDQTNTLYKAREHSNFKSKLDKIYCPRFIKLLRNTMEMEEQLTLAIQRKKRI